MASDSPYFDVCIFCAMAEEAEAVIEVFSRQCKVRFEQAFSNGLADHGDRDQCGDRRS
jgi:hypothetical protein